MGNKNYSAPDKRAGEGTTTPNQTIPKSMTGGSADAGFSSIGSIRDISNKNARDSSHVIEDCDEKLNRNISFDILCQGDPTDDDLRFQNRQNEMWSPHNCQNREDIDEPLDGGAICCLYYVFVRGWLREKRPENIPHVPVADFLSIKSCVSGLQSKKSVLISYFTDGIEGSTMKERFINLVGKVLPCAALENCEGDETSQSPDTPVSESETPNATDSNEACLSNYVAVDEDNSLVSRTLTVSEEPTDCDPKTEKVEPDDHKKSSDDNDHVLPARRQTYTGHEIGDEIEGPLHETPTISDVFLNEKRRMSAPQYPRQNMILPCAVLEKSGEVGTRRGPFILVTESKPPDDATMSHKKFPTNRMAVKGDESLVPRILTVSQEPADYESKLEDTDDKILNNAEFEPAEHKELSNDDDHVLSASELTHADEESDEHPWLVLPWIQVFRANRVIQRKELVSFHRPMVWRNYSSNIKGETLKTSPRKSIDYSLHPQHLNHAYTSGPPKVLIFKHGNIYETEKEEPEAEKPESEEPEAEQLDAVTSQDINPYNSHRLSDVRPYGESSKVNIELTVADEEPLAENKPEMESSNSYSEKPDVLDSLILSTEVEFTKTSNLDTPLEIFTESDIGIFKNRDSLRFNIAPICVQTIEKDTAVHQDAPDVDNDGLKNADGKQSVQALSDTLKQKPCFDNITDAEARLSGFTANSFDENHHIVRLKCETCGIILNSQPAENVTLIDLHSKHMPYCPFIESKTSSTVDQVTRSPEELDVTDGASSVVPDNLVIRLDATSTQTTKPSLLPFLESAGSEDGGRILNLTAQYARTLKGADESKETLDKLGLRTNDNDLQQMGREENRKKTFLTYPNHKALKLTGFVDNGWFWTGVEDEFKCFRCDAVCSDWHSSVDPLARHIQLSPDCPFLLAQYTPEYRERISKENPTYTTPKPQDVIKNPPSRLIRPHAETRYATMIVDNYSKFYDPIDREIVSADDGLTIRTVGKKMIWRVMAYSIQYGIEVHSEDKILSILQIIRENKRSSLAESSGASAQKGPKATADSDFIQYDEEIRQKLLKSIHPASKPKVQNVKVVMNVDEVREQLRCTICLDSLRSVLFTPCCHLAACAQCGFTQALCPVCRRKIQATIKVNVLPSSTLALKNKGQPM